LQSPFARTAVAVKWVPASLQSPFGRGCPPKETNNNFHVAGAGLEQLYVGVRVRASAGSGNWAAGSPAHAPTEKKS
jgi:hypothetical protein